jgi:protein TonB
LCPKRGEVYLNSFQNSSARQKFLKKTVDRPAASCTEQAIQTECIKTLHTQNHARPETTAMNTRTSLLLSVALLAGCTNVPVGETATTARPMIEQIETTRDGTSTASTVDSYKVDLAQRIYAVNSTQVYTTRPQALLRSVVVLKYTVDSAGNLIRSEIARSNHDRTTEATALATLRKSAPFPKPSPHLLRNGRLEMHESWLFNNDGRFQLRSLALVQMSE